jgi:hypothetical protein
VPNGGLWVADGERRARRLELRGRVERRRWRVAARPAVRRFGGLGRA